MKKIISRLVTVASAVIMSTAVWAEAKMKMVNPAGVNIPGVSQAVVVESGKVMYLSGHVPMGADGKIVGKTIEEQLDQVLANMKYTLKAAGTDFSSLVRVTVYIKGYDITKLAGIRKVRDKWLNMKQPPASALIGVAELFHPQALVEVDAVAVLK